MRMIIKKSGNSHVIRVSPDIMKAHNLKKGDVVEVNIFKIPTTLSEDEIRIRKEVTK